MANKYTEYVWIEAEQRFVPIVATQLVYRGPFKPQALATQSDMAALKADFTERNVPTFAGIEQMLTDYSQKYALREEAAKAIVNKQPYLRTACSAYDTEEIYLRDYSLYKEDLRFKKWNYPTPVEDMITVHGGYVTSSQVYEAMQGLTFPADGDDPQVYRVGKTGDKPYRSVTGLCEHIFAGTFNNNWQAPKGAYTLGPVDATFGGGADGSLDPD